jgi:hypothetical protein
VRCRCGPLCCLGEGGESSGVVAGESILARITDIVDANKCGNEAFGDVDRKDWTSISGPLGDLIDEGDSVVVVEWSTGLC